MEMASWMCPGSRLQAVSSLPVWGWMSWATQPGPASESRQWTRSKVGVVEWLRVLERGLHLPPLSHTPGEEEEVAVNLREWYFILAYCVGGVLVVGGLAVVVFVCWLSRDQCWERVAHRKPTRVRVRRSKVTLGNYHETTSTYAYLLVLSY